MPRFGQTGITVVRPGGVVTALPGWPSRDYFKSEDWCIGGAVPSSSLNRPAGELCWWGEGLAGGYAAGTDQEAGHPGVRRLSVTGVGAQGGAEATASSGTLTRSDKFDSIWVVKPVVLDSNSRVRFGFSADMGTDPPQRGFYFEKLNADTNFFAVTRESGTQTRVDTGVLAATSQWLYARLAWVSATQLGWALVAAPAGLSSLSVINTNLPQALKEFRPGIRLWSNSALEKAILWDYFDLVVRDLGRA